MPFGGDVITKWLPDGEHMLVLEALYYTDSNCRLWTVPAGFVTDGASIPRELWSIVGSPFTGKYRVAAVLHDAAYQTPGIKREDADRMLREASIELGCSVELADILYEGVRLGGAGPYAEDQQRAYEALKARACILGT